VNGGEYASSCSFPLDPFQVEAIEAIDAGRSVLVAAPTGAGKTVVAEYAVAKALDEGGKAFYTTPIKALSNQKFGDLARRHGSDRVGLLTGDNSISGDAPAVVMTTEVLRNMIYAGSPTLAGLRFVVLDEVHYLQDRYRGPVWEEVIIHTPADVDLVCLSATVSNAEEFADWIQTVRGTTTAIISERRPVELHHLYMAADRSADRLSLLATFVDGRPNPQASRLDHDDSGTRGPGPHRSQSRGRFRTPRRADVVQRLAEESMLPAIYFIFSRNACDDAVSQCLDAGLRLNSPEEAGRARAIAESCVDGLSDDDLAVLGYGRWLGGLEAGIAAHHAGMVPPFKEAVELCFSQGLVKSVFATETLALGINMPARSVVIEKLSKFTGERHEFLTPGQYTQLTGRAGRRGIDEVGYAIVLWSPFVPFEQVAGLASTRTYALSSSFRPTYNMAANLVRRYPADTAHHLLNLSFAQYCADRDVVRLEAQLDKTKRLLDEARGQAHCDCGDVSEYRQVVRSARAERSDGGNAAYGGRDSATNVVAIGQVRLGDVLLVGRAKTTTPAAVVAVARRRGGVRLTAVTADRRPLTLAARDFTEPPRAVAHIDMPVPYAPRNPAFQRAVAQALRRLRLDTALQAGATTRRQRANDSSRGGEKPHSVASCPEAGRHLRALDRVDRLSRDAERLATRVKSRTESLARQFDRVLRVLQVWGYVEDWSLTEAGEQLARIYHECDLLVAECLRCGLADGLDPPAMAAMAAAFTYEQRGPSKGRPHGHGGGTPGGDGPWFPPGPFRQRWEELCRVAAKLNRTEQEAGLPPTRGPDPGFFRAAHGWASGEDLAELMAESDMSGGDFVRNVKQLIDLLRQIGQVAADPATASAADKAADALFRGVVAASSVVG